MRLMPYYKVVNKLSNRVGGTQPLVLLSFPNVSYLKNYRSKHYDSNQYNNKYTLTKFAFIRVVTINQVTISNILGE